MSTYRSTYSKWYAMPAFLVYFLLFLFPSLLGMMFSFTNWNVMSDVPKWIGFKNYTTIFADKSMMRVFGNTVYYAVATSVGKGVFGLLLALALNRSFRSKNALRTIFFLPMILSNLIVGLVFQQVYHPTTGILNGFLNLIGLNSLTRGWIIEPGTVMGACAFMEIWKAAGFNMIIFLAGLQGVPEDLYEACAIDGAGPWKKFTRITLPCIMPSVTINMLLNVISGLKVFDAIFALTNGGPGRTSEVVNISIFHEFSLGNYGYGTALNTIMFVALALISIVVIRFYTKDDEVA